MAHRAARAPRRSPATKGYSYPHIRAWLRRVGVRAVIPERRDQVARRAHRRRHVIENCVGWLKEACGVATQFEKLAIHYLGLLKRGMIRTLMRRLHIPLPHRS